MGTLFVLQMAVGNDGVFFYEKNDLLLKEKSKNDLSFGKADKVDTFFDPSVDYSKFSGRISDRQGTDSIFKIQTEAKNVKFFRAGDKVLLRVGKLKNEGACTGYVRSVEKKYLVLFLEDLEPCWGNRKMFRRGTIVLMESSILAQRVKEASIQRNLVINQRRDFFYQLNKINHEVWTYDQRRVEVVAKFDKQIIEIEKQKKRALEKLLARREDAVLLQAALTKKLDAFDEDIRYFLIEKEDFFIDRWHFDHDLGIPMAQSPQNIKRLETPEDAQGQRNQIIEDTEEDEEGE